MTRMSYKLKLLRVPLAMLIVGQTIGHAQEGTNSQRVRQESKSVVFAKLQPERKGADALAVTVKGKITDEQGQALPGVSVIVKGTATGTSTDNAGAYSLSVSDEKNAVLVFSFIGYLSQEISVSNRSTINVTIS